MFDATSPNRRTVPVSHQRCFNHASREAVAKCLECGRFFCRECVTEHEGRVICAVCLEGYAAPARKGVSRLSAAGGLLQLLVGVVVLWFLFYLLGQGLLMLPAAFHEGTIWGVGPFG